ncbi:MAG: hypothetical protein KH354_09100 [Clostridiales bacterium]|nr:hypothetical protein [Clostridiales bacterium]
MKGKERCRILKELRQQIAQSNDIELVTEECQYQGECAGTCPRCEAEVRYLEQELARRQKLGRAVVIAGIAATVTFSAAGCDLLQSKPMGELAPLPSDTQPAKADSTENIVLMPAPDQSANPTEMPTVEVMGLAVQRIQDGE